MSDLKKLTFVTGNSNKLKEVVAILSNGVVPPSDGLYKVGNYEISNISVDLEEVQGTIDEVTICKAKKAAEILGGPVLVEDTSLAFTAFNDLPGPYIKWFVNGVGLQGLNNLLYCYEDKSAHAICTFGYCAGPGEPVLLFQGKTKGNIVPPRGHTGFGWDAVFEPIGYKETYAEMDKEVKNKISHRFKALDKLRDYLLSN
ncbi:hypothetical protein PACTADRAFT_37288 [Pachysolen tannophilus NRRL Y-2460]|uniref:Inosine triphosphate pyrophosphatase n=1 Tax=Pachysolen tannophilus NRRL Y-2460 TaxID=669874 RepID=A0A1E4U0M0_PACTA|nr:hypothetical protein PACTADRAFT_37288 [Pachysolen tannophilus NRRL Y-2460]